MPRALSCLTHVTSGRGDHAAPMLVGGQIHGDKNENCDCWCRTGGSGIPNLVSGLDVYETIRKVAAIPPKSLDEMAKEL